MLNSHLDDHSSLYKILIDDVSQKFIYHIKLKVWSFQIMNKSILKEKERDGGEIDHDLFSIWKSSTLHSES